MFRRNILIPSVSLALVFCTAGVWADQLTLTGLIRDVKRGDWAGGHPDFETCGTVAGHGTYGVVHGLVAPDLGSDTKPVYNPVRPHNDSMSGATNFNSWYHDVTGVNLSTPYSITLSNGTTAPGGTYTYTNQAFFPIDAKLWGNQGQKDASGVVHNFSFTYELHNKFSYTPGQVFTFTGDDDVWVYVNNKLVIDIGGVHSAASSSVRLFDGKAFVDKTAFTLGGYVQSVSTSYAAQLATSWSTLRLSGTCPIKAGDYYIDLNLNTGGGDIACSFAPASVTVRSSQSLTTVVVRFDDGSVQEFDNLQVGGTGTFSGTGGYKGKNVIGVWVNTGNVQGGSGYGRYYGSDGSGGPACTLDFFFAERHTVASTFRIDTSILLQASLSGTFPPLYD